MRMNIVRGHVGAEVNTDPVSSENELYLCTAALMLHLHLVRTHGFPQMSGGRIVRLITTEVRSFIGVWKRKKKSGNRVKLLFHTRVAEEAPSTQS